MGYYNLLILHTLLTSSLLLLIPIVSIQDSEIAYICSGNGRIYFPDTNYSQSLEYLVEDLSENAPKNKGFRKASRAEDPTNWAYGLALCRGDVTMEDCKTCLTSAKITLTNNSCPNSKAAIIWRDFCQLKYSDVDFLGRIDNEYSFSIANGDNARDSNFAIKVEALLKDLSDNIDANTLFGSGSAGIGDEITTVYGMVKCTRDLSRDDCKTCLRNAVNAHMTLVGDNMNGAGRYLFGSCNVRYADYFFLQH